MLGRVIEVLGSHEISDQTALVDLDNARPGAIEFLFQSLRLVGEYRSLGQQFKQSPALAGHGCIKLPSRKYCDAARAHRLLDDLFISGKALAREPHVNGAQQIFTHRSFREWQQQGLVHRTRRSLGRRIKLANRLHLVAEKLDAHRPVRFRRIDIQNSTTKRILAGHFDYVRRTVADRIQVAQQSVCIE